MLWRYRILALLLALAAARGVWGWAPIPVWTVDVRGAEGAKPNWRPLGFSPDNSAVFTGHHHESDTRYYVKQWSVTNGELQSVQQLTLPTVPSSCFRGVLSPCGRFLALISFSNPPARSVWHTWLFRLADGTHLGNYPLHDHCTSGVPIVAFSPDGELFAFMEVPATGAPGCNTVTVVSTAEPAQARSVVLKNDLGWLRFSPDSKRLAVHSWRGGVRVCELIDVESGQVQLEMDKTLELFFLDDERVMVVTSGNDRVLRCLDLSKGYPAPAGITHDLNDGRDTGPEWWPEAVRDGLFLWRHPHDEWSQPATLCRFDPDTGEIEERGSAAIQGCYTPILSQDGAWGASLDEGRLSLWDLHTPRWKRWPWVVTAALLAAAAVLVIGRWHTMRRCSDED